jgi:hypothetical protein
MSKWQYNVHFNFYVEFFSDVFSAQLYEHVYFTGTVNYLVLLYPNIFNNMSVCQNGVLYFL